MQCGKSSTHLHSDSMDAAQIKQQAWRRPLATFLQSHSFPSICQFHSSCQTCCSEHWVCLRVNFGM